MMLVAEGLCVCWFRVPAVGSRSRNFGDTLESFLMLGAEDLCLCWFKVPAMRPSSQGCPHGGFIAEPRSMGF